MTNKIEINNDWEAKRPRPKSDPNYWVFWESGADEPSFGISLPNMDLKAARALARAYEVGFRVAYSRGRRDARDQMKAALGVEDAGE